MIDPDPDPDPTDTQRAAPPRAPRRRRRAIAWLAAATVIGLAAVQFAVIDTDGMYSGWRAPTWLPHDHTSDDAFEYGSVEPLGDHTTIPFRGPVALAIRAPFWLRRGLEARVRDDVQRLLPDAVLKPAPVPEPGDQIDAPIVVVDVRRTRWWWLPITGRIGADAIAVALDPEVPFAWPDDPGDLRLALYMSGRPSFVGLDRMGVEIHHGQRFERQGFALPSADIDFLVDKLASSLANELVTVLTPPQSGSGPVFEAMRTRRPTLASVLAEDGAGGSSSSRDSMSIVSEGVTNEAPCTGTTDTRRLIRDADGWHQNIFLEGRSQARCRWIFRLRNVGPSALTSLAAGDGFDPPWIAVERWQCAEPGGAPEPCEALSIGPGGAVDVAVDARITGCDRLHDASSTTVDLVANATVGDDTGVLEVPLHTRLVIEGARNADCLERGPTAAAMSRVLDAVDARRRAGDLGPAAAADHLDRASVRYQSSLDGIRSRGVAACAVRNLSGVDGRWLKIEPVGDSTSGLAADPVDVIRDGFACGTIDGPSAEDSAMRRPSLRRPAWTASAGRASP